MEPVGQQDLDGQGCCVAALLQQDPALQGVSEETPEGQYDPGEQGTGLVEPEHSVPDLHFSQVEYELLRYVPFGHEQLPLMTICCEIGQIHCEEKDAPDRDVVPTGQLILSTPLQQLFAVHRLHGIKGPLANSRISESGKYEE